MQEKLNDSILIGEGFIFSTPEETSFLGLRFLSKKRSRALKEGRWKYYTEQGTLLKEVIYIRGQEVEIFQKSR